METVTGRPWARHVILRTIALRHETLRHARQIRVARSQPRLFFRKHLHAKIAATGAGKNTADKTAASSPATSRCPGLGPRL